METELPLILEPKLLEENLKNENCIIVDLSKHDNYLKYHLPESIYLDYSKIIKINKPVMGLLPDQDLLSQVLTELGASPATHIIAYDDEGGGKAARLLWTLDIIGHQKFSLLNGGIFSWANEGHELTRDSRQIEPGSYTANYNGDGVATKEYILSRLHQDNTVILDCRTAEEYSGVKKFAEKGGHIPGAVNLDWMMAMDQNKNFRLKSDQELTELLQTVGVTVDKEIIVYCQTHHRSSHTYVVLKSLGFNNIKGFPGAWSDWGNDPDTPVET